MHLMGISEIVSHALYEDLTEVGDITANCLVDPSEVVKARVFCKQDGVLYGLEYATEVLNQLDPHRTLSAYRQDGDALSKGDTVIEFVGSLQTVLAAERTALNFLGHLSGVATTTNQAVRIAKPHGVQVACTRKTIPLLRMAQKLAVKAGGGGTHRFGLYDAAMIKDNHLVKNPDIAGATQRLQNAFKAKGIDKTIEVEVDTLEQLKVILPLSPDVILLDNMSPETIQKAIEMRQAMNAQHIQFEASGNITLETLEAYCRTGVDVVSMGWLTHSATNLDFSLEIQALL